MIFKEHDFIKKGDISSKAFEDLKKFASYEENYKYLDIAKGGNALKVKNYVGTITTKDGTTIEILPKIYGSQNDTHTKQILLNMLKTLKNYPFKNINKASLKAVDFNLLEIFITMFLEELTRVIKKGIRSDYFSKEENLYFLKGKIKLNSHIRQNILHKERFYVEFDEYSKNRAENRLIKTTLKKLHKISKSPKNKQRLREVLFIFDDVETSSDIQNDFKKCKTDRYMKYYREILKWSKIFLNNQTFSPYKGKDIAYALLFDMNLLFESYVAHFVKKRFRDRVRIQDKKHKLIESHRLFQLIPDIVIDDDIVMDTKWKLINQNSSNYDLSQTDLYQMYAYGKKYNSRNVYLVYPKSKDFHSSIDIAFGYDESLRVHILCFDFDNEEKFLNFYQTNIFDIKVSA